MDIFIIEQTQKQNEQREKNCPRSAIAMIRTLLRLWHALSSLKHTHAHTHTREPSCVHTHLYFSNKQAKNIKKSITFMIASKRIKYLGINFTEEVQVLYTKNYNMSLKSNKEAVINGKSSMFMG